MSMKTVKRCYELLSQMSDGELYTWNNLRDYSKSPGRDVKRLLDEGLLKKVGPGLYLRPKKGRFGDVALKEQELVKAFLKSDDFLIFSTNFYNSLGLGLTQLKNETVVYNKKRYEPVTLSGRKYYFKRPNNAYPDKLTAEFLLVDLMNNLDSVGEAPSELQQSVVKVVQSHKFNNKLLFELAQQYGKVATKKFFSQFIIDKPKQKNRIKMPSSRGNPNQMNKKVA